ncbi:hypothetical protein ACOQFV_24560 [Nocardiopsis changdeensis]|uniref:Pycsar effector protein domain-containing protein n=1 Tax=Nocardiopsis changdeensis TaxID=2831969 RepID=A0A975KUV1_9ACTN|nr:MULTISPECIES: hypothetical protein [Nocardiopsis]QUX26436.1 hypothetical protein KGD84_32580 [Nocardiopsis changdeensis]QYX40708.1 hypothetical protein K1J57_32430 [Nocardiopsis sp. MT53]
MTQAEQTGTTPAPEDNAEQPPAADPAPVPAEPAPEPAPAPVAVPAPRTPVEAIALAEAAAADAVADLTRTDTSNAAMAGMAGVLLTVMAAGAGLSSGDGAFPAPAQVAMGAAAVVLSAVLVTLAAAIWPRHGGTGGVPHYARRTAAQLAEEFTATDPVRWHAERAAAKAAIATRKHRHQRVAAAGLALAGVLLAAATVITLI